jgi:hypothetical protein
MTLGTSMLRRTRSHLRLALISSVSISGPRLSLLWTLEGLHLRTLVHTVGERNE